MHCLLFTAVIRCCVLGFFLFFFFFQAEDGIRDVAVTGVQTCALPISSNPCGSSEMHLRARFSQPYVGHWVVARGDTLTLPELGDRFKLTDVILDSVRVARSEEHTSELQSRLHLVCRLLLEKKKKNYHQCHAPLCELD